MVESGNSAFLPSTACPDRIADQLRIGRAFENHRLLRFGSMAVLLGNSGKPKPLGARIGAANDGKLVPACVRPRPRKSIAKTRSPALKRARTCFPRLSLFKRPPGTGTTARFPCPSRSPLRSYRSGARNETCSCAPLKASNFKDRRDSDYRTWIQACMCYRSFFADRERNANSLRYSRTGLAGVPQNITPFPRRTFFGRTPPWPPIMAPDSTRA